jgi:hypothetical protein
MTIETAGSPVTNETRAEQELRRLRRCLRRYEHDENLLPAVCRVLHREASDLRARVLAAFAEQAPYEAIEALARRRATERLGKDLDSLSDAVRESWLRAARVELSHVPDELIERLARASFMTALRRTSEEFDALSEYVRAGWIDAASIALLFPVNAWPVDESGVRQTLRGMCALLGEMPTHEDV